MASFSVSSLNKPLRVTIGTVVERVGVVAEVLRLGIWQVANFGMEGEIYYIGHRLGSA